MFQLDYRDSRPIYLQVKESLYHLMLSGALDQGDQLPSVRSLASDLAINPNTISRAYDLMEKEGLIYTVQGKGTFVAPLKVLSDQRKLELLDQFDRLVGELQLMGLSLQELQARIQQKEAQP